MIDVREYSTFRTKGTVYKSNGSIKYPIPEVTPKYHPPNDQLLYISEGPVRTPLLARHDLQVLKTTFPQYGMRKCCKVLEVTLA